MNEVMASPDILRSTGSSPTRAGSNSKANGALVIVLYALASVAVLDRLSIRAPESYILPLYLVCACAVLIALESGRARFSARGFWMTVALALAAAIALPLLAWPDISFTTRSETGVVIPIICAVGLGSLLALWSHFFRHNWLGLAASGTPALLFHGTVLTLGAAALNFLPSISGPYMLTPLSLISNMLVSMSAAILLIHLALSIEAGGRWLMHFSVVLAGIILLAGINGLAGQPLLLLVLAVLVIATLPFTSRSPVLASLTLAAFAVLLPHIPFVLTSIGEPADPTGTGNAPVLLSAAAIIGMAALARQAEDAHRRIVASDNIEKLRTEFARLGAGRLLRADLNAKRMYPITSERGSEKGYSFADFFRGANSSEMLELLNAIREPAPAAPEKAFAIKLNPTPLSPYSPETPPAPHRIHILDKTHNSAWLGLLDISEQSDLEAKVRRTETALGEALLREERLLSVASHELRTPMSILSMLAEELDSGTPWNEIAPGFKDACNRIDSVLDDLRVHDGREDVQLLQTVYTLREMAQHLQEVYTGPAQANGVALLFSLSQQSDTLIQSDYGRIFIALSKLIHNAIIHARASEISVSVFLTRQTDGAAIATWQVSDNGRGIPAERRQTIFRPFDTDGTGPGNTRPGLGLYTARNAVQAMGGELILRRPDTDEIGAVPRRLPPFSTAKSDGAYDVTAPNPGTSFILKHPVRLAKHAEYTTLEHLPMTETQATYPDKTVLLIEDNQIVGEITVARLRRLFGTTIWAERGDEALLAYENSRPDLLLVDQLLPGMLGSEVIKRVRETNRTVPIIGITASAMGSECAELEGAGANYALEKPLSLQQMQKVAAEFFGQATTSSAPDS